jgi:hypothetical protein
MIRALRQRHRFAAIGLALLLPPLYALALAARSPEPRVEPLAAALREPDVAGIAERRSSPGRGELPLSVSLGRDRNGARVVELDTRGAPVTPDALVYFSAGLNQSESLPPGSIFLGALPQDAVRAYALPNRAAGAVVVFSLAWQRVVASAPVAAEGAP